eukprot:8937933-Pyramimonas_sp.AAC.1
MSSGGGFSLSTYLQFRCGSHPKKVNSSTPNHGRPIQSRFALSCNLLDRLLLETGSDLIIALIFLLP